MYSTIFQFKASHQTDAKFLSVRPRASFESLLQRWFDRSVYVFQVFCEYFKELEEESIRDNFVIIYELLDELMDFGYPQTTDSKILQE